MSLTQKNGFFPDYYLKLKNSRTEKLAKEIERITDCRDDFERMAFVEKLEFVRDADEELRVERTFDGKNETIAAAFKEKGNQAFKSKNWLEAMILYSKSYIALPNDKDDEKSIILANRSATLYHMEKYDEALIDIKRSIALNYPKALIYKLFDRQARCYMARKDYPNSVSSFKKFITSLDDAELAADKRSKMNLDAMTMLKMLERDPRTAKQFEKQKKQAASVTEPTLAIPDEKEFFSASVALDENKDEGRFAKAVADITVGEEILVEKPFVAVLLEKYSKTHCEHCFMRTAIPLACANCADIVYCSEKCLKRSASRHKYECGILPTIWRSGASINCHLALRIIASKSLEYYLQQRDGIDNEVKLDEIRKFAKNDYRRVSHLERHQDSRSASNFFQHALMARFLTKCLQAADYFGGEAKECDSHVIGGFILRNLQFLQFNTHEVSELHHSKTDGNERTVFIGGALYPTLALFNHSCDPGVVRYFRGTTIHVNTVKSVEAGLQISENYGPMYTQETRDERQAKLKDLYWFDCSCDACLENWPKFANLPNNIIRFRCDAPNKCSAVIEVPANCNEFMIKCVACGESTNIFKGLKVMQDTEMMTRTAKRHYDAGDYSKALAKYIDLLKIMNEVLAPPFIDFCQCQQNIRDCFLHFGNFYNLD